MILLGSTKSVISFIGSDQWILQIQKNRIEIERDVEEGEKAGEEGEKGQKRESGMKLLCTWPKTLRNHKEEATTHIIVWVPITNSEKFKVFFSFLFLSGERESIETEQQKTRSSNQDNGERKREIWEKKKKKNQNFYFLSFSLLSMVYVPFRKLQEGIEMLTSTQGKRFFFYYFVIRFMSLWGWFDDWLRFEFKKYRSLNICMRKFWLRDN